jgi:hypothetical protein
VPDLETLRRLAPPVEPATPDVLARARAKMRPRRRRPPRALLLRPVAAAAALAIALTQTGGPSFAGRARARRRGLAAAPDGRLEGHGAWTNGIRGLRGEMTFPSGGQKAARVSAWCARPSQPDTREAKDSETLTAGGRRSFYRYKGQPRLPAFLATPGDATVEARAALRHRPQRLREAARPLARGQRGEVV